ncbi:MAG: sodium:solute symporter [Haloferacaceae archaeon]
MSAVALAFVGLYLLVVLAVGWYGYRRTGTGPDEYFLAGGTLGRVVYPLTMFATLVSAFNFLGSAGFGYVHGLPWFTMLAVTSLAGLPLALVGYRAWRLGRDRGYITPTEYLGDQFDSDALKILVVVVQFVWAVPYLAIQAIGGGVIVEVIAGGTVGFEVGALLVVAVTAVYLSLGGLRGAAWSDVIQGVVLVGFLSTALVYIQPEVALGRFFRRIAAETGLLTTAGNAGFFTPRIWLSFLLMNGMAVIAYPQVFQRFFAAEGERSFRSLIAWWPAVLAVTSVVPVVLGIIGTGVVPDLANPDRVVPRLLQAFAPAWLVGVIMGGAVAAMMSTADSLVLTLSSLVTRDLYHDHVDPGASDRAERWVARGAIAVLLAAGYGLALSFTGTIVELSIYFIQGNALLLPVLLAPLYWRGATAAGALASVVLGQGYLVAAGFGPAPAFGFMPFVPALALACLGLFGGSLLTADRSGTVAASAEEA